MSKIVSDFLAAKFTRIRLIAMIFTFIVLLLEIAFATGIPFAIAGCNNPPQLEQCGTVNILVSAGTTSGTTVVTFAPAFASIPIPMISVCATATGTCAGNTLQVNLKEAGTMVCFLCVESAGVSVLNMPAAVTELFGDVHHEAYIDLHSLNADDRLQVDCIAGSSSATAFIQIQASQDGGTTFFGWSPTLGIGSSGTGLTCGSTTSTEILTVTDMNIQGIPQCSGVNPPCGVLLLRVVTGNGNGVGDSPTLNMITYTLFPYVVGNCVIDISARSVTSMTVRAACPGPPTGNLNIKVNWYAKV